MIISMLSLDDYEEFVEVMNEFRNFSISKEQFQYIFDQMEKTGNTFNYVARENEKGPIIGTAKLVIECKFYHNGRKVAHVEDLVIKKEHNGKGYGSLFLKIIEDIACIFECYKLTLECETDLLPFYEKNNFKNVGNSMSKTINSD